MPAPSVVSLIQPSFNAGELSPLLFGRVDLEKYKSGLALARNVFVDYRGGLSNRGGSRYIDTIDGTSGVPHALPFTVNTQTSYVLVFDGDGDIKFYSNGAYVSGADLVSPYALADLPLVKFNQSANVMTLTHPSYPPYEVRRTGPSTFTITPAITGPEVLPPTNVTSKQVGGNTTVTAYAYVVTAVSADGKEESLPTLPTVVDGDVLSVGSPSAVSPLIPTIFNEIHWRASTSAPAYYKVYKAGPIKGQHAAAANKQPLPTVYGYIGQSVGNHFIDNNITADYSKTPPQYQDPFSPGQIAQVVPSGGSGYTPYYTVLSFTGDGTDAAGYGLVDPETGTVISVIMTNFGKNYTTPPTVTDDMSSTTTYTVTLGQLSGTYPAASTYYQQRATYGGTNNLPESFVASVPGKYHNFDTSPISNASDSITASIASTQNNTIKAMVPMSTGLIIFTFGGAFLISGGQGSGSAITPSSIVALPQASFGASDLPPIPINYTVLYTEALGFTVRDLTFDLYRQNYVGVDRSILSSHLFFGYTFRDWAFCQAPFRTLHMVRNEDGQMLTLTYVPEQEMFAWTHYDTNGQFISCCSVPEGANNVLYAIVRRYIRGTATWVYFLERFAERDFTYSIDPSMWFVDAGLALPQGQPTATLFPAISGTTVTMTYSGALGVSPSIGDVVQAYGAQIRLTGVSVGSLVGTLLFGSLPTMPNDPFSMPVPLTPGNATITTPVTTISGLNHLEGMQVTGVADGKVIPPTVVVGGSITLAVAASSVVVGLPYTAQAQTLRVTSQGGVMEGKRRAVPVVTLRLSSSAGVQVGRTFDTLMPQRYVSTPVVQLTSADVRTIIGASWNKDGQICFQQSLPLPMTVLADMPEVVAGDTYRG